MKKQIDATCLNKSISAAAPMSQRSPVQERHDYEKTFDKQLIPKNDRLRITPCLFNENLLLCEICARSDKSLSASFNFELLLP